MRVRLGLLFFAWLTALSAAEADWLPIEREVAEAAKSSQVTVVHFWAPWCPNCNAELAKSGWSTFVDTNYDVNFIFVTIWNPEDGRALLEKNGLVAQKNFRLLQHPNGARKKDERVKTFMDLPVTWIPTTWVFKDGQLRYALNYGEVRFPLLQQLIRDSSDAWEHKKAPAAK
jgi:thiol-disulfide isomerase/thioredoxin